MTEGTVKVEKDVDEKKGILKNQSNTETTSTNTNNSDKNNQGRSDKFATNISSQAYNYGGESEHIDVILALRTERFNKKVVYSTFIDKLKNYVLVNFSEANDIIPILEHRKDTIDNVKGERPKDLESDEKDSDVAKMIMAEEVKEHVKRLRVLRNNKQTLYGVIWGQCSSGLQEVIKGDEEYVNKASKFDVIWLVEKTKLVSAGVDEKANIYCSLIRAITSFVTMHQGALESNDSFWKRIESNALTMELAGGEHIMYSPKISQASDKENPKEEEKEKEVQRFKAMIMILRSDPARFSDLQESLFKGVYKGRDEFPETLTNAYDLLQQVAADISQYTTGSNKSSHLSKFLQFRGNRRTGNNVTFTQQSLNGEKCELVARRDGKVHPKIVCHNCGKTGHYANQCTKNKVQFAHFVLAQSKLQLINNNWILLNTCSTISVCCNENLVHHIRNCAPGEGITVLTNGGSQSFAKTADLNILPIAVHYNPELMANILSLVDVANLEGARLTMDTGVKRAIILHYDGHKYKFNECADGLYYLDVNSFNKTKATVTNYSHLTIVEQNKTLYTKRDVAGADTARNLQHIIGWPSNNFYHHIVNNNLINNSPISTYDIHRANKIYGPASPLLKGKMTCVKPLTTKTAQIPTPQHILNNYPYLDIFCDFFFVNSHPFLLTTSSKINFLTTQTGENRTKSSIIKGLQNVYNTYSQRGFNISSFHADNEFDMNDLRDALKPATLEIYGAEEHVGSIEREVRTVKERTRAMCHSLPYQSYPKLMTTSLVEYVIFWLNAFPSKTGASNTISPAAIVTGAPKPDFNLKYIPFGAYAIVYAGTNNNMKGRGIPAIALKPSNYRGDSYFMSLLTGERIHAYSWVKVPITTQVIDKVHKFAEEEGQKLLVNGNLLFEWNVGTPYWKRMKMMCQTQQEIT